MDRTLEKQQEPVEAQQEPEEEFVTATEAKQLLKTTRAKIAKLIDEGLLPVEQDELDRRIKWIPLSAVKKLQSRHLRSRQRLSHVA